MSDSASIITQADLNALPLDDLFAIMADAGDLDVKIERDLHDDLGEVGDITTTSVVDAQQAGRALIIARADGIVSGLGVVERVAAMVSPDLQIALRVSDGDRCNAKQPVAQITGPLRDILAAERTMLNYLAHLSGIATLTRRFIEVVAPHNAVICDTRKTTPGLRHLEKYAVRCGGGTLHRLGLHDALLYKDNHLAGISTKDLAARLAEAIQAARAQYPLRFVEVEVDSLDQLEPLLTLPQGVIDIIMLDNMSPAELRQAVTMRDEQCPSLLLEASGSVNLQTVADVAATGVDRIAIGAITHSAANLDFGLDMAS